MVPSELRRPIFLLPGIGPHPKGWAEPVIQRLRLHYLSYPSLAKKTGFDDAFECIALSYGAAFEAYRHDWQRNPVGAADAQCSEGVPTAVGSALRSLAQARGSDAGFACEIIDFVQYGFLKRIRREVQAAIAQQIHQVLEQRPSVRAGNWAVIAHSLGTSVAHDTLHAMYRKATAGRKALDPSKTFMSVMMMVANTSRLLERDADVYRSMVRPMTRVGGGICEWYLNVRHEWDPVPMPKPFEPVLGWPTPDAVDRLRLIRVRHFLQNDFHGLDHYLEDPDVHVPLFEGITAQQISEREVWEARDRFKRRSSGIVFESLRARLKGLQLSREDDWSRILPAWTEFAQITQNAA